MAYTIEEAKKRIVDAGHELVKQGLVARTWGNISARVSSTQFAITPSGRAYDTLTPDQIVVVNIADGSYEGTIKPSSERGIHADAYRHHPNTQFIIHTHQINATVWSVTGKDLTLIDPVMRPILGDRVPCAPYGISATKSLRRRVKQTLIQYPASVALLMRSHGALCLGGSFEEAFAVASALEKACAEAIDHECQTSSDEAWIKKYVRGLKIHRKAHPIEDFGTSIRVGNHFLVKLGDTQHEFPLDHLPESTPNVIKIHHAIYHAQKVGCILFVRSPEVVAFSLSGQTLHPAIDDLAQIAGVTIKNARPHHILGCLKHRNAVLIYGRGALVTGHDMDDAMAVRLILEKGCRAEIFASMVGHPHRLGRFDAWLQRTFYVLKYSKMKRE
jgi:L-ribulose-5-phosphate 4-epimerase